MDKKKNKDEFTVIPLQGIEIKRTDFQPSSEQPRSQYDVKKVVDNFPVAQEINGLISDSTGRQILATIGTAHENGHIGRCNFVVEQSVKMLGMENKENKISLDYRNAIKARNESLRIPEELNNIYQHHPKNSPKP